MNTKQVALGILLLVIGFASGRMSSPSSTITLGSGAELQGPMEIANVCIVVPDNTTGVTISRVRFLARGCSDGLVTLRHLLRSDG